MKRFRTLLIPALIVGGLQAGQSQDQFPDVPPEAPALLKLVEMYHVGLIRTDGMFRSWGSTNVANLVSEAVSVCDEEVRELSTKLEAGSTNGNECRFRRLSLWLAHVPEIRSIIEEYDSHLRRIGRDPEKLLADLNQAEVWILRNQDQFPDTPPQEWFQLLRIASDGMLYPDPDLIRHRFGSIADGAEQLTEGYMQHVLAAESLLAEALLTSQSSPERVAATEYAMRVKNWRPHIATLRTILRDNEEHITSRGIDVDVLMGTLDLLDYRTRVIQFADYEGQQTPFPDVPEGHWAYQVVNNLKRLGILVGYPDHTYKGDS